MVWVSYIHFKGGLDDTRRSSQDRLRHGLDRVLSGGHSCLCSVRLRYPEMDHRRGGLVRSCVRCGKPLSTKIIGVVIQGEGPRCKRCNPGQQDLYAFEEARQPCTQ